MSIRTKISNGYRWRIGIVGLAAVAFGCWFIYDWQIGYPKKQERYQEYRSVVDPDGDGELLGNYQEVWYDYATEKGYSTSEPKEITDSDVQTQLYYGLPCFLVGLPFFGSFLLMGRRFIETDDDAIWDHKGNRAAWDQITEIDKSRWQTKGIAVIHFDAGDGEKRIVLDDWKFERNQTQRIMAHVDGKVGMKRAEAEDSTSDESPEDAVPADV